MCSVEIPFRTQEQAENLCSTFSMTRKMNMSRLLTNREHLRIRDELIKKESFGGLTHVTDLVRIVVLADCVSTNYSKLVRYSDHLSASISESSCVQTHCFHVSNFLHGGLRELQKLERSKLKQIHAGVRGEVRVVGRRARPRRH